MTDYRIVPIQEVDPDTIDAVAAIHMNGIASLLGDLGIEWVKVFYQHSQRNPDAIGFVLIEGDAVAGYVIGAARPEELYASLRRRPFALAWTLLTKARGRMRHVLTAKRIVGALTRKPGEVELMYLTINPAFRRRGYGSIMIRTFLDAARERGATCVTLSVEKDNEPALGLYEREGCVKGQLIREGGIERWRMIRVL